MHCKNSYVQPLLCRFFNNIIMNEYYVLVPKSLNLEQRLSKFPPDFELSRDYCHYFISELLKESSYQNQKKNDLLSSTKFFIPRCSQINQPIYRGSKKHLDYLYKNFDGEGRMLFRTNYEEGKCFSYNLPEYYWGDGELELVCITEEELIDHIRERDKTQVDNIVRKRFNFTINYFDIKRFEFDHIPALNELYLDYQQTGNYAKYLKNAVRIMKFKNGYFPFWHKPGTDGRLHTAITQFPKKCRKYLKYDGENLAEVDLSSSIPFFLSYMLSIPADTPTAISAKDTALCTQLPYSEDILYHYMLAESSVKPSAREIADFAGLVRNNQLYEFFMVDFMNLDNFSAGFENMFNRAFDGDMDELKKYSKRRLLSMFFASPKKFEQEQAVFYRHFPSIHDVIKNFKQAKFRDFKKSKRHKKLSYMLFQLESHFMVHTIAREINNKHKRKIPLFTLHDCLVVKESDLDQVYQMMHDIFIREIGYAPNMTKKIWR